MGKFNVTLDDGNCTHFYKQFVLEFPGTFLCSQAYSEGKTTWVIRLPWGTKRLSPLLRTAVWLVGFIPSQDLTYYISRPRGTTQHHAKLGLAGLSGCRRFCICLRCPENTDVCTLQPQLLVCFHYDFLRQLWHLQN